MKLKYGAPTGFADPRIWAILSAQPAYQTQRSIARPTAVRAAGDRDALGRRDLGRELVEAALHELGDAVQDLAPVHRRARGPAAGRAAGRADRVPDVLARRPARVRERRAIRRSRDEVRAAALGPRELAAEVQLVGLQDRQPVRRRRRRGGPGQRPPGHQRSSRRTYAWSPCMPPSRPKPDSL